VDAVEISTSGGHVVALGLPETPYPYAGETREVLEDVHRLGGFGIAAHPDSPKSDLLWRDWGLPVDGIELINLDTAWRKHLPDAGWRPTVHLLAALGTYLVRPAETITRFSVTTDRCSPSGTTRQATTSVDLAGWMRTRD
jgi:hypothetical protein